MWWIDYVSTIHIANSLQDMQSLRKASGKWAKHLILKQDELKCWSCRSMQISFRYWFYVDFRKTFYVSSFSWTLVSVSKLVLFGLSFEFLDKYLKLSICVENDISFDSLYRINFNMLSFIIQCMLILTPKDLVLIGILLCYDTGDYITFMYFRLY